MKFKENQPCDSSLLSSNIIPYGLPKNAVLSIQKSIQKIILLFNGYVRIFVYLYYGRA